MTRRRKPKTHFAQISVRRAKQLAKENALEYHDVNLHNVIYEPAVRKTDPYTSYHLSQRNRAQSHDIEHSPRVAAVERDAAD